jgi:hypothetical protein
MYWISHTLKEQNSIENKALDCNLQIVKGVDKKKAKEEQFHKKL